MKPVRSAGARRSAVAGAALVVAAGLIAGGCSSSSSSSSSSTLACPAKHGTPVTGTAPAATGRPAAGWTQPDADLASTRYVASAITSTQRLEARGGVDGAADDVHGPYRRGLRDHAGDRERGGVRPGPGLRRVRDQPGHRQGLVDARLQLAQRRAGWRQRGRRGRVRGHQ